MALSMDLVNARSIVTRLGLRISVTYQICPLALLYMSEIAMVTLGRIINDE